MMAVVTCFQPELVTQVLASGVFVVLVVLSFSVAVAQSWPTVSGQVTSYQNDRVLLPAGAVKVWAIEEVPLAGLAEPSIAAYWPLCGLDVVTEQTAACPPQLQPVRVVSKPPLPVALALEVTVRV